MVLKQPKASKKPGKRRSSAKKKEPGPAVTAAREPLERRDSVDEGEKFSGHVMAPAPVKRHRWAAALLWLAALVAVAAAGAWYPRQYWIHLVPADMRVWERWGVATPPPPGGTGKDRAPGGPALTLSEADVQALRARIKALETQAGGPGGKAGAALADLESLRDRVTGDMAVLLKRLDDVESGLDGVKRLAQATTPPTDADTASQSLKELSARLQQMGDSRGAVEDAVARIKKLEEASPPAPGLGAEDAVPRQVIDDLISRVRGLEGVDNRVPVSRQAMVLAINHLRESLRGSAPFAQSLEALKTMGGTSPEIRAALAAVEVYADTGIADVQALRLSLDQLAAKIGQSVKSDRDEGLVGGLWARLSGLVEIRRTDVPPAPGNRWSPVVGKARNTLAANDLAGAVRVLEALQGDAAEAARPWLERARARLAAERTMAVLHVHAASLLTSGVK